MPLEQKVLRPEDINQAKGIVYNALNNKYELDKTYLSDKLNVDDEKYPTALNKGSNGVGLELVMHGADNLSLSGVELQKAARSPYRLRLDNTTLKLEPHGSSSTIDVDLSSLATTAPARLSSSDNLNSITNHGDHICESDSIANTSRNYPENKAGYLEVRRDPSHDSDVYQTYKTLYGRVYFRVHSNRRAGGWTDWNELTNLVPIGIWQLERQGDSFSPLLGGGIERAYIQSFGSMGIIHMDGQFSESGGVPLVIPEDCPVRPSALCQPMLSADPWRSAYIVSGSRNIHMENIWTGRRVVVDIICPLRRA